MTMYNNEHETGKYPCVTQGQICIFLFFNNMSLEFMPFCFSKVLF